MCKYKKEELSKNLLERCARCYNGGKNIFPDYLDFNPITDCFYFDDINDDDPRDENYDCGAFIDVDTYNELRKDRINT
jgi:hypothetical protein